MSRKKSKYKPKGVRLDNLSWLIAGMKKVGTLPTAGVALKLKNHEALDSILTGVGTKDHVDVLIAAVNMSEALIRVRDELGVDWVNEIKAAQDAIYSMGKRGVERGSFVFTGPEMTAVKLVMDIHDSQLDDAIVVARHLLDHLTAQVGGHDHHGVAEIDRTTLTIRQAAIIQHLQQHVKYVRVGLFDFVEQDHAIRVAAYGLGQITALVVTDIARGRAD